MKVLNIISAFVQEIECVSVASENCTVIVVTFLSDLRLTDEDNFAEHTKRMLELKSDELSEMQI